MNNFLKDRISILIASAIALLVSILCVFVYFYSPSNLNDFLNEIDLRAGDIKFRTRGPKPTNPNIAIVAIDEKSINEIGRWVWSREEFVKIVDKLSEYGPRVIAFDIVFSEEENEEIDQLFSKSLKNNNRAILGYFFRNDSTETIKKNELKIHKKSTVKLIKQLPNSQFDSIKEFQSADLNISNIALGAKSFGYFNIFPDKDGVYRRSNLVLRYKNDIFPSLNLSGLQQFLKAPIFLTLADYGIESIHLNKLNIPVDEQGRLLLNFYGKTGIFPTYSIADVLSGKTKKEKLQDKFVFIGATEIGIADLRATPFDPAAPGVEVQATVASNVLDGNFLIKNSLTDLRDILIIFVFSILLALIISNVKRSIISLAVFFLFILAHIFINYLMFTKYNQVLSFIYPFLAMGFTYIFYEGYRNLVAERRSKFLKTAFSSYVSPDLVSQIMDDPDKLKLGGDKKEVTILFSDIRGFTSLSEKTTPEVLVSLLNEYLTPMTDIVMEEKGTLDKYIGDAVMAIFGAPLDLENHSERACIAAVSMINKVDEINDKWEMQGLPTISIGIGLNTGEAIVGNMGANIRFDYTAIGDNVNLASRLEGLNKYYGTEIIISESSKDQLPDPLKFNLRELDLVKVKGKEKPISIFEIIVDNGSNIRDMISEFDKGISQYRSKNFTASIDIFNNILEKFPHDEPSKIYIERCKFYIENSPPNDWDYVYTAESK